jgi:ubiquinone/menaquinone biosynthesis C-methylase UbiE
MSNDDSIREIVNHYGDAEESSRLRTGWFQLERARTEELILRHLPPPPATIIDAGGGAGAYACWLAARGWQVHLIDPVPKHVEQARAASARQREQPLTSSEIGDARDLPHADSTADAVLLLGPLYHLVEREDRLACLREAHRVLRPRGLAWGAAISYFASLFGFAVAWILRRPCFRTDCGARSGGRSASQLHRQSALLHRCVSSSQTNSCASF